LSLFADHGAVKAILAGLRQGTKSGGAAKAKSARRGSKGSIGDKKKQKESKAKH